MLGARIRRKPAVSCPECLHVFVGGVGGGAWEQLLTYLYLLIERGDS